MKTLQELNDRAWYRFLKIIYILVWLTYPPILYFGLKIIAHQYHNPVLPATVEEALTDPEFYKLSEFGKRVAIGDIDEEFKLLTSERQKEIVQQVSKRAPTVPLKEKYIYESYYAWNTEYILWVILFTTLFYLIMLEGSRRAFYYVVLGKAFPPKRS
jgi:hypothetical protein